MGEKLTQGKTAIKISGKKCLPHRHKELCLSLRNDGHMFVVHLLIYCNQLDGPLDTTGIYSGRLEQGPELGLVLYAHNLNTRKVETDGWVPVPSSR